MAYQFQNNPYQQTHSPAPLSRADTFRPPPGAPPQQGGHAGFSNPAAYGPPPGADPQLWQWFRAVDEDRSDSISCQELQRALVNGNWAPFDLDTVKLLMALFDTDRSGTITFNEFAGLWKYIADWQNVFRHFDRDGSGSIDQQELNAALKGFGYNLSNTLLELIMIKYSTDPASRFGPPPSITFDRFVRCCVVIKTLTESFQQVDTDRDGWIQLNYESFLSMFLRAP